MDLTALNTTAGTASTSALGGSTASSAAASGEDRFLKLLVARLRAEIPDLDVAFAIHGYQDREQWPGIEQQLLAAQPDLVLAALGVPRQETWIQHLHLGQQGLWMGVGGSFDVWSGCKQRAPEWMGRLQIEWLYRLIQEPSRWRRMLALPAFAWAVLRRG